MPRIVRDYPSKDSDFICCFCGEVVKVARIAFTHGKNIFHPYCAAECAFRSMDKLAHVRSRFIKTRTEMVAMEGLLKNNKEGFRELADENIQLMDENTAMTRLLKVGK